MLRKFEVRFIVEAGTSSGAINDLEINEGTEAYVTDPDGNGGEETFVWTQDYNWEKKETTLDGQTNQS